MNQLQCYIGNHIRRVRTSQGLSIEELAHRAKMNAVHLSALERGEKNATLSTLKKICDALDIPLLDLFALNSNQEEALSAKILNEMETLTRSEKEFVYQTAHFLNKNHTGKGQ